jgi:hypothetical protein
MELKEYESTKTTTKYWGYRELTADELLQVGGGDDGDGPGGDDGDDGDDSGADADSNMCMAADFGVITADQAMSLTNSVIGIAQGGFGANAIGGLLGNISTGVVGIPSAPSGPPPADLGNPGGNFGGSGLP